MASEPGFCALCERLVPTTRHHLIPKQKGGRWQDTVPLCQPCHVQIHVLFTNTELKRTYHTIEQLRTEPRMEKFVAWLQAHPRLIGIPHR